MPAAAPDVDWPVLPELRVTDPQAAELLWVPTKRRHLKPFLGRSSGLADAAEQLGVRKTAMSYWIKRLLALGLIRERGQALRGGRRVAQYRCVADRLLLSLQHAPHESYEAVFEDSSALWRKQALHALGRSIARQAPWLDMSVQAYAAAGGIGIEVTARGPDAPPDDYLHYWGRLWLTADEADALRRELDALWDRYGALADRKAKPVPMLLHLMVVPDVR